MITWLKLSLILVNFISVFALGNSTLVELSKVEALEDFDHLVRTVRTHYAPLEYKERKFSIKFDDIAKNYRDEILAENTEQEYLSSMAKFVAEFKDGHFNISFPFNSTGIRRYHTGIFVAPVGDKFVVWGIHEDIEKGTPIRKGDELLLVDGETPDALLEKILKYSSIGNVHADKHRIFNVLSRPYEMKDLFPTKSTVTVKTKNAEGREFTTTLPWKASKLDGFEEYFIVDDSEKQYVSRLTEEIIYNKKSYQEMAKSKPFFINDKVTTKFSLRKVYFDDEHGKKYGLREEGKHQNPDIYAAIYRHKDKNILLVRNYKYNHKDYSNDVYMAGYRAIFDQWEEFADVMVLDQTHNGGGSYCSRFHQLFAKSEHNAMIDFVNVDKKMIYDIRSNWSQSLKEKSPILHRLYLAFAQLLEIDYNSREPISSQAWAWGGNSRVQPDEKYQWKKPLLVLVDELSGSCGDAFPMLVKANKTGKIFGQTTMGLGGFVQKFEPLPYSRAQFRLTRSLFTTYREDEIYRDQDFLENDGVEPDYKYEHTIEDFRAGFVGYVEAFSDQAVKEVPSDAKKSVLYTILNRKK